MGGWKYATVSHASNSGVTDKEEALGMIHEMWCSLVRCRRENSHGPFAMIDAKPGQDLFVPTAFRAQQPCAFGVSLRPVLRADATKTLDPHSAVGKPIF